MFNKKSIKEKKCLDCKETKLIKHFRIQKKYVSKKGKGISFHYFPYCKNCLYIRIRNSNFRNKENILKWKKYQKKYNKKWQEENRNGTGWQTKYKKVIKRIKNKNG